MVDADGFPFIRTLAWHERTKFPARLDTIVNAAHRIFPGLVGPVEASVS